MSERQNGDPWIIEQLDHARWRNRNGDNPNMKRGRMIFDFGQGKVRVEATGEAT